VTLNQSVSGELFCHPSVAILVVAALCGECVDCPEDTELSGSSTISIVDDDPFARDAIGDLIQSLGYRAVTFPSAEQFLDSGRIGEVACLIADVQMPGMSGFDLQNHLQAAGYNTPVIFISAFPEERFRTRALNAGAVAFLSKPFEETSLIGCIDLALAGHQQK
jgi:FixJ family two-component response regulator